jgi:hypothetical protein
MSEEEFRNAPAPSAASDGGWWRKAEVLAGGVLRGMMTPGTQVVPSGTDIGMTPEEYQAMVMASPDVLTVPVSSPFLEKTEPRTTGEKLLSSAAQFTTAAAPTALASGWLGPARLAVQGPLAGIASELGRESFPEHPVLGSLGGALLGGSVGGLTTSAAERGLGVGGEMALPLTERGQQTILPGRILNDVAAGGKVTPESIEAAVASQPAGVNATLGDLTNDAGLQTVQRTLESRDLVAGGRARSIASANNQQLIKGFDQIGQPGSRAPTDISEEGMEGLEAMRKSQQQAAAGVFPTEEAMVSTAPLQERYGDYVSGLTAARRRFLPDTYKDLLDGYDEQEPLQELQDFRSTLQTEARQAASGANPDYNKANVLNGLHDALFPQGGPEELLLGAGAGTIGDQLRAARDQWRAYAQTYTDPTTAGAVRTALRPGTPNSTAFDGLLGPGKGQAERAQQFVNASQGDPAILQAGRDWFAAKMRQAGATATQDLQGDPMLNGNLVGRFVQNNRPLIDSEIFDDSHRAAIAELVDAANMLQSTARAVPRGGPDTFRHLQTEQYLQGLGLGPAARVVAQAVPRAIGAGVGELAAGPVGAFVGQEMVRDAMNYPGARSAVLGRLAEAVHDPLLAARLMREAAGQPLPPAARPSYVQAVPGMASGMLSTALRGD